MTTTRMERAVLAVAVLLLVAGLVSVGVDVGGGSVEDQPTAARLASSPALDTPVEGGVGERGERESKPGGARAKSEAGEADAEASASGGHSQSSAPADPAERVAVAELGAYRYRVTADGEERTSTLRIEDAGGDRRRESRDDGGRSTTSDVVWSEDAKVVERTTFEGGGQGSECDWEPDITEFPRRLREGSSWSTDSSCEMRPEGFPGPGGITLRLEGTSRVSGATRTTVAGRTLDVWVIRFEGTFTFGGPEGDEIVSRVTSRDLLSPRHGLFVRSTETMASESGDQRSETTREILNLRPE